MRSIKLVLGITTTIALLCLLACLFGVGYNALSLRHYRQISGVPGKLYDVGGYKMHLYCTGQGSPTVVLASGLGDDFTAWKKVQPVLAQQTRVCAYDRAGFGWSDSRPGVQDANAVSSQLHQLVEVASIQRPLVLVGHSISGLYLRSYAAHYPGDLAGIVFVDGATPLQDDRIPRELVKIQDDQRAELPHEKLLMELGWYRLRGLCTPVDPGDEAYSAWTKADTCVPSEIDAVENELDAEHASGEEVIHAGPFGNLPVLILSRDPKSLPSNWPAPVAKANSVVWDQMQEEAKGLSSQSRRIIAKGSDHYIQSDRPELVNREIPSFVTMLRNRQGFPDNHSTTEK